ncbi:MAG TPA: dipeptide epimerase [Steroidobacteraceae bacterium]|nr:dipeptide epimerase [Steroidobacteraceae bacterium]
MASPTRLSLEVVLERLPLKAPFRISGYTFHDVPVVLVVLSDGVHEGRGEAAGVYYLEDVPADMAASIEAQREHIERGITRAQLQELLPIGGARNALDCALWELDARRSGKPVWQLAGCDRVVPLVTTFTLGADDPATMVANARACFGARALKLKLSGELDVDIERVRAVREARKDVWLGVDANQGFTPDTLTRLLPVLTAANVSLLEQPLARGREADLEGFDCPIPLAADESVQGVNEIEGLVGRFDVVNIKLDKCGGLTEALAMVQEAKRLGLDAMVGNMVGSSLAMAPAFVCGQRCDVVDLDGPTFLSRDRMPAVSYNAGSVWCADEVWGGPRPA